MHWQNNHNNMDKVTHKAHKALEIMKEFSVYEFVHNLFVSQ